MLVLCLLLVLLLVQNLQSNRSRLWQKSKLHLDLDFRLLHLLPQCVPLCLHTLEIKSYHHWWFTSTTIITLYFSSNCENLSLAWPISFWRRACTMGVIIITIWLSDTDVDKVDQLSPIMSTLHLETILQHTNSHMGDFCTKRNRTKFVFLAAKKKNALAATPQKEQRSSWYRCWRSWENVRTGCLFHVVGPLGLVGKKRDVGRTIYPTLRC